MAPTAPFPWVPLGASGIFLIAINAGVPPSLLVSLGLLSGLLF